MESFALVLKVWTFSRLGIRRNRFFVEGYDAWNASCSISFEKCIFRHNGSTRRRDGLIVWNNIGRFISLFISLEKDSPIAIVRAFCVLFLADEFTFQLLDHGDFYLTKSVLAYRTDLCVVEAKLILWRDFGFRLKWCEGCFFMTSNDKQWQMSENVREGVERYDTTYLADNHTSSRPRALFLKPTIVPVTSPWTRSISIY